MSVVPSVRAGLLRHKLDGQVLIYDTNGDRVHLLDTTTACVLDLLEEGGRTADGITGELARRIAVAKDEGLYTLSVEELRKADLLDETTVKLPALPDVTRRELVRKIALTGAAALLIPAVATLSATSAYAGGSPVGIASACINTNDCPEGLTCRQALPAPQEPNGPGKTCQP